ncbi:PREDICTED: PCNA-interacting partner-like [Acropora digitifera]|uniref:PCNA-interacting partner-like n=1 Tax=Acropora digitifera TaxID=70779 RepID=UPI00077A694A|nr:PREDICTED: PCNA-interacting partner-like [Acropora digitifera]
MVDCLFWIAEENLQKITKAIELFRSHDGWKDDKKPSYLGFSSDHPIPDAAPQRPLGFLIDLYREHSSKRPFCDSIFGLKEQMVALQLVMAQFNKQEKGEFTVQSKDVLEAHQNVMKYKLAMEDGDEEIARLCSEYNKFLSYCNAVDFVDILQRVKTCFIVDTDAKNNFQTLQQLVVVGKPNTQLEEEILALIAQNRMITCFTVSKSDGQFSLTEKTLKSFLRERNENCQVASPDVMRQKTPKQTLPGCCDEAAKVQLLQVMLSYLRLLVNTRDELALSQVINIPHRGLGHQQFTALRKVAREKNMPMFQSAVSFILRIRLGGKSYAPRDDSPLLPLTKGLGEFVTFFQKLQNICEETANAKAAVLRTITLLKVGISKSKERVFTAECLTEVMEDLKQNVEQLNTDNFTSCESSMSGMKAYFLIQSLLDRYVKQKLTSHLHHQTRDINDALVTPETAHGKSKVRSLLTQFRTPDVELVLDPDTSPEKLKVKPEKPFDGNRKVYGDMAWAKPAVSIKTGPSPQAKRDHIKAVEITDMKSSYEINTKEHNADGTPKCRSKKRTLNESLGEKENITVPSKDNAVQCDEEKLTKPSAKRILLAKDTSDKNNLKTKAMNRKSRPNRKQVALLQGQKQLTSFFR